MLSQEDLAAMMAKEEKSLGVNSPEFMGRHKEIMEMAEQISRKNKKNVSAGTTNTGRDSNPVI